MQNRGNEQQREVAVDYRGDPGQNFQDRLDGPPGPVGSVLAEVDGAEQPQGQRHEHREDGGQEGGGNEGQNAEVLGRKERRPTGAGNEFDEGDFKEELKRLEEQDKDDSDSGKDGEAGTEEQ